ncbi:MAG: transglutaminase domain-containing protein [Anaerolineales bacterium]|nr:transglutaminase domain-containing protein [Anaerolineales bacterium]
MKKTFTPPTVHWWDWWSVVLIILLLQTAAARLSATEWTPSLGIVRGVSLMGAAIGLALGYSAFSRRKARWLSFGYMLLMLPLQWTVLIEGEVALEEKLASVGGRLFFSLTELFAQRPVDDPLLFIAVMSVAYWVLSASAGFQLTRRQNFFAATLPALICILVIQNYDNVLQGRIVIMAFFLLEALLLLGRLNFLQEEKRWKDKRITLSPETSLDLTSGIVIAAGLLIVFAWTIPPTFTRIDTLRKSWNQITRPWNEFTGRFKNAVSALDSKTGGSPNPEFYGTQLELGQGFSLSEAVMFTVRAPELPAGFAPPRYYWRGRVYDNFTNDRWSASQTQREEFSPEAPLTRPADEDAPASFIFTVGQQPLTLLYTPTDPIWISRPGSTINAPAGAGEEILSWSANPGLMPGETYQVEVVLHNPSIEGLRAAGTDYPEWVTQKYLQLPNDVSPRIRDLAAEIAQNAETPYDQASAITRYLREHIKYSPTVPKPPFNADPLEWVLFDYKQAFCVYYASIEVVMLRSLGIPARMAVGFAEGTATTRAATRDEPDEVTAYTVRKMNAHAWPEVYFPGIGWVEFEPTGNQSPLNRPLTPRENSSSGGLINSSNLKPDIEPDFPLEEPLPEDALSPSATNPLSPLLYAVLLVLGVLALTVFLTRRYAIPERVPALVRTAIERGGIEAPAWVLNWERWAKLSPIEKSFDSVNFALRQLKQSQPLHATPIERADKLIVLLPEAAPNVKVLLDEHQTSLYTSRTADARSARRAAFTLRYRAILARFRHILTGKNSPTP